MNTERDVINVSHLAGLITRIVLLRHLLQTALSHIKAYLNVGDNKITVSGFAKTTFCVK